MKLEVVTSNIPVSLTQLECSNVQLRQCALLICRVEQAVSSIVSHVHLSTLEDTVLQSIRLLLYLE